jgi:hypothetical protein
MRMRVRFGATLVLLLLSGGLLTATGGSTAFLATDSGRFFVNKTGDPAVVQTQDFANGQSAVLGSYNLVAHENVNLKTLEISDGAFTITADDGATIHGEYSGTGATTQTEGVITYLVSGPITRGTGRFYGAGGKLTFSGVADLRTGVLSEVITGQISLHASRDDR